MSRRFINDATFHLQSADAQQNVAGKTASVTILRFQQESAIVIITKP